MGEVAEVQAFGKDARVIVRVNKLPLENQEPGSSIAVNGVCLTVIELADNTFTVDISAETLSCTTLADLSAGSHVNLEPALTPTTALGGHLVSGHVDGVGQVISITEEGRSIRFGFSVPAKLAKYVAEKGSIAIDGVSLTVNNVADEHFDVNIIPHTMEETRFGDYKVGSRVNLEADIIARYLDRLYSVRND